MAAQRADARAGLTEIAAQQQQVGNQAHVGGTFVVLGDPHAVGNDGGAGSGVDLRHVLQVGAAQAGLAFYGLPGGGGDIGGKRGKPLSLGGDKIMIQRVQDQKMFCNPF